MDIDIKKLAGIVLLAVGLTGITNLLIIMIPESVNPWITYGAAITAGIYLSDGWHKK